MPQDNNDIVQNRDKFIITGYADSKSKDILYVTRDLRCSTDKSKAATFQIIKVDGATGNLHDQNQVILTTQNEIFAFVGGKLQLKKEYSSNWEDDCWMLTRHRYLKDLEKEPHNPTLKYGDEIYIHRSGNKYVLSKSEDGLTIDTTKGIAETLTTRFRFILVKISFNDNYDEDMNVCLL